MMKCSFLPNLDSRLIAITAAFLIGCTTHPSFRIEQSTTCDDRIQLIACTCTTVHVVDSAPFRRDMHFYMLEYAKTGPECPPAHTLRAADLNAGMSPLTQQPGVRLDFFMGSDPDRIVRVLRRARGMEVTVDLAVLGPSGKDVWAVLKSWSKTEPADRRSIIPTIDGRLLVFTDEPVRVLDTHSMQITEASAPVKEMVDLIFARTAKQPAEFLFTEDLRALQAWVGDMDTSDSRDMPIVSSSHSLQVESGSAEVIQRPENELLVFREGRLSRVEWVDWEKRTSEAWSGNNHTFGGFASEAGRDYIWDVEEHRSVIPATGRPKCSGYPCLIRLHGNDTQGGKTQHIRILDLEEQFPGDDFHFVGKPGNTKGDGNGSVEKLR